MGGEQGSSPDLRLRGKQAITHLGRCSLGKFRLLGSAASNGRRSWPLGRFAEQIELSSARPRPRYSGLLRCRSGMSIGQALPGSLSTVLVRF